MRLFALLFFAFLLYGCTSVPFEPQSIRTQLTNELKINDAQLLLVEPVRYGIGTRGARFAEFNQGVYAQTDKDVVLYRYERNTGQFHKDLVVTITKIQSATPFVFGMFGNAAQLQINTDFGVLAVNFRNQSDADSGDKVKTELAFLNLSKLGVSRGFADDRVIPSDAATPIPIIIVR